jgi:hypothetical protein
VNRSPDGYGAARLRRYEIGGNSPRERTSLDAANCDCGSCGTLNFGGAN